MPSNMHAHSLRALLRIRMLTRSSPAWGRMALGLLVLAALAGLAQQQTAEAGRAAQAGLQQAPPAANPQSTNVSADAADTERRRQIADESARLLKLATDLKAEVDKTTKDTLSLEVIRKADAIERFAHDVKEKKKLAPVTH